MLSIVACESLHAGLTVELKEAAFRGIKPYLDDCRAQTRKVCDLATYYRERRWERFAAKASGAAMFHLRRDTPAQTARWRKWFTDNEPAKLPFFEQSMTCGRGYTVTSEWPPPKRATEASAFVGDSDDDSNELSKL